MARACACTLLVESPERTTRLPCAVRTATAYKEERMDPSISRENRAETERIRDLAGRLSLEELRLPLGEGWTVGAALAHLAFWDRRALVLLTRWKDRGPSPS